MKPQTKIEVVQSISGIGAFVLGVGVSLFFYNTLINSRIILLVSGIVVHGWGMMKLSTLRNEKGELMYYTNHWLKPLLWICILLIMSLIIFLLNS